jgi:Fe-S cluster biosynthesis and repair protein YggX
MTTTVICSRCEQEKPAQPSAPMGGEVGQRVLENVCADCWAEWRETSARIINHYGLVLGNPDHRAQLRVAMLQFLALDDEDDGDGAAGANS